MTGVLLNEFHLASCESIEEFILALTSALRTRFDWLPVEIARRWARTYGNRS